MSMNLAGGFFDKKGRCVKQIEFWQTPTELSYKIVPHNVEKILLTRDNYEYVLRLYFDMVGSAKDTQKKELEELFDQWGDDYTAKIWVW